MQKIQPIQIALWFGVIAIFCVILEILFFFETGYGFVPATALCILASFLAGISK